MSACTTLNTVTKPKGTEANPFLMTQGITFRLTNKVFKSQSDGGGPFILSGFTGRSQMRVDALDTGAAVVDFTVTISVTASGIAEVKLDASLSTSIVTGTYVFDIEYIEIADPENIISGTGGVFKYIRVLPGVTKP